MRIGVVRLSLEYVVDLDNEEMVQHAMNALYDDIHYQVKYNSVHEWITAEEEAAFTEADIPEFLLETFEEEEDEDE